MHIEKRLINGTERDVEIEDYQGEHDDREKDRRNMAHADRVASQLGKNKKFIAAIAQAIMDAPIQSYVIGASASYTVTDDPEDDVKASGDYKDSNERKGR